jgi:predicted amidophosphoribosyltransferase
VALRSRASDALVSVFFPAGCRLCERVLVRARTVPICEECLGSFAAVGGAVCERCGQPLAAWSLGGAADVVVPVPLHRQRERERGYNQADLIARPLARKLGVPYRAVLLVRTKPRPGKYSLSLEEPGTRYVPLLPHVQAGKLTTYAYC